MFFVHHFFFSGRIYHRPQAHDDQSIGRNKFTLVPIANLATKEKNTNVDLCVVVMEVGAFFNYFLIYFTSYTSAAGFSALSLYQLSLFLGPEGGGSYKGIGL